MANAFLCCVKLFLSEILKKMLFTFAGPTNLMEIAYFICINSAIKPKALNIFSVDCASRLSRRDEGVMEFEFIENQYDGYISSENTNRIV